jgi:predicted MFS family arabinose efflux permease
MCNIVIFAIYAFSFRKEYLPLIALLYGPMFILFWINYNILFFSSINSEKKAFGSAIYAFAFSFLATLVPIISGFTASRYGMKPIFMAGIAAMIIAMFLALRIKAPTLHYRIYNSIKCIKGVRLIIFLEGFWEHLTFVAIPLLALFFIKEEVSMGAYLSYLGLIGAAASLIIAKISDRAKKRWQFIRILGVSLGIATMFLVFSKNIYLWVAFTGLLYLISPALKPFQTTVALDNLKCGMHDLMVAREFMLNLGRLSGILVFLVFMLLGIKYGSIFVAGLAMLAYPLVVKRRGYYAQR